MGIKTIFLDYLSLVKPRLALLNIIAAASGTLMTRGVYNLYTITNALVFISLLIGGAGALNCALEAESDSWMHRTKRRPIPAGRIKTSRALMFGAALIIIGLAGLLVQINFLTFILGILSVISYLLIYTPLKRKTHFAVYAGAVPGALPPVLGYTSITNNLDLMSASLFLILFCWQIPHFLAISIYQSKDYADGKIMVYPNVKGVEKTRIIMVVYAFLTCVFAGLPYFLGFSGLYFLIFGLVLGMGFIYINSKNISHILDKKVELDRWAKKCFFASIIYLPLLFGLMVVF